MLGCVSNNPAFFLPSFLFLKGVTINKFAVYFGVSVGSLLGEENQKVPTTPGERDLLDEVDVAFYGDYKELSEDDKETLREMARVMRDRRVKKNQEK